MNKKLLNKILIRENFSIKNCMKKMTSNGMQICIVQNDNNNVIGTITDGDIRRSLLSNKISINDNVKIIMNKKFIYSSKVLTNDEYKKIFLSKEIKHIPIIKNKKLIDLVLIDSLFLHKNTKFIENTLIIIMAGGKGERLLPYTKTIPKPMLNINGRPMLENLILNYFSYGFKNFYLTLNYKKNLIIKFFKNKNLKYKINFASEKFYMGTAGSLSLVKNYSEKIKYFVVINCDIFSKFDLNDMIKFHVNKKSDLTILTRSYNQRNPFGVINSDNGKVKSIIEKPISSSTINAGVYIFSRKLFNSIPNKNIAMDDLINQSIKKYNVFSYNTYDFWIDLGVKENYLKFK